MLDYFRTSFFPEVISRGIDTIIHCGDVFDRRKYVNFLTMKKFQHDFFEQLVENDLHMLVIPGNHDCPLTNMTTTNSLNILLRGYDDNVTIFNHPTEVEIDGSTFLFSPWISLENSESSVEAIEASKARFVVGHYEINGFEVRTGSIMDHGMEMSLFSKFELVMSGHFHKRSTIGNITYVGTPYQLNWGDHGMVKGFHILDTETGELEFVPSPKDLFTTISYNDTVGDESSMISIIETMDVRDQFVRIYVYAKTNPYLLDLLVDRLESRGAISVQVISRDQNYGQFEDNEEHLIEALNGPQQETTEQFITRYIEQMDLSSTAIDKTSLINLLLSLYHQAVQSLSTTTSE